MEIDSDLAHGLQTVLDFEEGYMPDVLGITFSVSSNPLISSYQSNIEDTSERASYVALKDGGDEIYVDKSNRQEFVKLFVNHTLYGSCARAVQTFLNGLGTVLSNRAILLLSPEEVRMHIHNLLLHLLIVYLYIIVIRRWCI